MAFIGFSPSSMYGTPSFVDCQVAAVPPVILRKRPSTGSMALSGDDGVEGNTTNVYVSNLPRGTTDAAFEQLVTRYGQIFSYKVVTKSPHAPPVGFVQYVAAGSARAALEALDGRLFRGSVLRAKLALRDKDKGVNSKPSANLYICNLPSTYTTEDLRHLFEPYGRIVSLLSLAHQPKGHGRGTGFVRFSSVKEARAAKDALHGAQVNPVLPLEVKFAESSSERSQRMRSREEAVPESPQLTAPAYAAGGSQSPSAVSDVGEDPARKEADSPWSPFTPGSLDTLVVPSSPSGFASGGLQLNGSDNFGLSDEEEEDNGLATVCGWEVLAAGLLDDRPAQGPPVDIRSFPPFAAPAPLVAEDEAPPPLSPPASPLASSSTVRIANLPPDVQEIDVYMLCAPFGDVVQVNVNRVALRIGETVAFVRFSNPRNAEVAQLNLHYAIYRKRSLIVTL